VPIPADEIDDMLHVQKFIDAVRELVKGAIEGTRSALANAAGTDADEAA
jgi:hypothetical protein